MYAIIVLNDTVSKSCFIFWDLKKRFREEVYFWQVSIKCLTVKGSLHFSQIGPFGRFSIRKECVSLVCPILILWMITCSFLDRNDTLKSLMFGIILWSFCSRASVSHSVYQDKLTYCFTNGYLSVYGTLKFTGIGKFSARLAALSASSFPGIPTWLGTQQNTICLPTFISL